MTLRVTTVLGQDPAYADSEHGIIVYALLRITPETTASIHRTVDIVWVQDKSGSMEGEKLEQSKQVLGRLIGELTGADRAGIITFNQEVDVLFDIKAMSPWHRRVAVHRVRKIESGGSTCLSLPLQWAILLRAENTQQSRTVVMLTDGNSTTGSPEADRRRFLANAKELADRAGRLIVVGMGVDYDAQLLQSACEIDPNFEMFHISTTNPDQLGHVAQDVMAEVRGAVMRNMRISGTLARGVRVNKLTTFVPQQRDHAVKVGDQTFAMQSGSLSRHRGQHLLLELMLEHPIVGNNPLLDMTITGALTEENGSETDITAHHAISLTCTDRINDAKKPVVREVRDCIVRAQAHRLMKLKEYDAAAALYEAIGDAFMVRQANWAKRESLISDSHATESHRATLTHSSRTVSQDWTSRGSEP